MVTSATPPKTIEDHLHKVFLKLGVSSRVELAHQPFEPVAIGVRV
jgi:DNA-binding NarL/FixJ family response regulator